MTDSPGETRFAIVRRGGDAGLAVPKCGEGEERGLVGRRLKEGEAERGTRLATIDYLGWE